MRLTDAQQRRTVMGHDGHPLLYHSALKAFVTHLTGTARASDWRCGVPPLGDDPSGTSPRHVGQGCAERCCLPC